MDDSETLSTAKRKSAKAGLGDALDVRKSFSKSPEITSVGKKVIEVLQNELSLAKARESAHKSQIERLRQENKSLKNIVKLMERRILRSEHKDD